jgi:uncharacterized protein (TIGR03492 family)
MANEQAVGLGKPVVTFPGKGPQITRRFLQAQKRLLGEPLMIADSEAGAVAAQVLSVLHDSMQLEYLKQEGSKRMGTPGAARRIARALGEMLNERQSASQ